MTQIVTDPEEALLAVVVSCRRKGHQVSGITRALRWSDIPG